MELLRLEWELDNLLKEKIIYIYNKLYKEQMVRPARHSNMARWTIKTNDKAHISLKLVQLRLELCSSHPLQLYDETSIINNLYFLIHLNLYMNRALVYNNVYCIIDLSSLWRENSWENIATNWAFISVILYNIVVPTLKVSHNGQQKGAQLYSFLICCSSGHAATLSSFSMDLTQFEQGLTDRVLTSKSAVGARVCCIWRQCIDRCRRGLGHFDQFV